MNDTTFPKNWSLKHTVKLVTITAMLLGVLVSCSRCKSTSSEFTLSTPTPSKPLNFVDRVWTFKKQSVNAHNPIKVTLQVRGTAPNAPFLWSVHVTDTNGSLLFQEEHDDRNIDKYFGDEGYISECKGYRECKDKWYFEELPKEVANGMEIIDHSSKPVEAWERDALVGVADDYLKGKGLSSERRAEVTEEMMKMLAGRFDSLYVPIDFVQEASNFMYVPSVGYFVPYYHP
jgi:hypothetical protein